LFSTAEWNQGRKETLHLTWVMADSLSNEYWYGDGILNSIPHLADRPAIGSIGRRDSHQEFRSANDWMRNVLEEENSEEENRVICGR